LVQGNGATDVQDVIDSAVQTVVDLSFGELEDIVQGLSDQALETTKELLVSAVEEAEDDLAEATRKWQKEGVGLPGWYSKRRQTLTVLEKKLKLVDSIQKLRNLGDEGLYQLSLQGFNEIIAEVDLVTARIIFAYLTSHGEISYRGQKIQIIQEESLYLETKRNS